MSSGWKMFGVTVIFLMVAAQSQNLRDAAKRDVVVHEHGNALWKELKFKIDDRIPDGYSIAHANIPDNFKAVEGLSPEIAKKEKEISWYWMSRMLPIGACDAIVLTQNIQGTDDGAFLDLTVNTHHYLVVDARQLTVFIHKQGMSNEDIVAIFENLIYYDKMWQGQVSVKERKELDNGRACGKIVVDRKHLSGWFLHPIEWYKDGDTVVFLFIKQIKEPFSKGPIPAERIIGGIPYDDPRPFKRFKESNRVQLLEEYYEKWLKDHPKPPPLGGKVGAPIR